MDIQRITSMSEEFQTYQEVHSPLAKSAAVQMKHLSLALPHSLLYVQGVTLFGLQPHPLGTAVREISTPPQVFPEPIKAGKKSFCIEQSLLSPGPALQLLTPLL